MAADERVEAHKDRAAYPRLGHACCRKRVGQRKRRKRALEGLYGRQHASVVMLYERVPEADRVVRTRVRCSPSVAGPGFGTDHTVLLVGRSASKKKGMTRTAPPETRAYAVHAFARLHFANKHAARFCHALPDLWRLV